MSRVEARVTVIESHGVSTTFTLADVAFLQLREPMGVKKLKELFNETCLGSRPETRQASEVANYFNKLNELFGSHYKTPVNYWAPIMWESLPDQDKDRVKVFMSRKGDHAGYKNPIERIGAYVHLYMLDFEAYQETDSWRSGMAGFSTDLARSAFYIHTLPAQLVKKFQDAGAGRIKDINLIQLQFGLIGVLASLYYGDIFWQQIQKMPAGEAIDIVGNIKNLYFSVLSALNSSHLLIPEFKRHGRQLKKYRHRGKSD